MVINDHSKSEEVYKQSEEYIKVHDELRTILIKHWWAHYEVITLVPETADNYNSGHFFPFLESHYELENSLELCKLGFYRYSFFALRCVLELGILGLYFDKDDQAHIDIKEWIYSKEPTPDFQNILKNLFQLTYFHEWNMKYNVIKEIKDIYSSLSNYVHTRGYYYSTSGQTKSQTIQFSEKSLLRYINLMERVIKNITIMILLKYPIGMQHLPIMEKFGLNFPTGGFPNESSRESYLDIIDENVKAFLQKISDNDPSVKAIVAGINNMPDLTEEEIQKQVIENEKWYAEHREKE